MTKISVGDAIRPRSLGTLDSGPVQIPDPRDLVHLQFRRFAGCPFCSLHLREFARRHDELTGAGVREVVVFRSTAEALQRHHANLPFAVVPDPQGKLYAEFGVESALRSVLDPHAWWPALRGIASALPALPGFPTSTAGALGLPAEFLIANDGKVFARHYGVHADDHWSVDDVLALTRAPVV